jgi:hypothetical protein
MSYLIDNQVILLQRKHLKGKNCRIYKLDDSILKSKIVRFRNTDKVLLKKLQRNSISENDQVFLISEDIRKKLIEDLYGVEIDYSKSIFFLDSIEQDQEIYNKNIYSVDCVREKNIFFHFDNYGRLHTNFTILKSFIRKNCLLIDECPTSEIDIKNSQPLFLSKLFENMQNEIDRSEYSFFCHLTKEGVFYDYLQEKLNIKDKKVAKQLTYKVLFGKNYSSNYDKLFKSLFPTIHQAIKSYKRQNGDYRSLSHKLQKSESDFIFNVVIREIIARFPNIRLITCHDSIICKNTDKPLVESIFLEKFTEHFGQL